MLHDGKKANGKRAAALLAALALALGALSGCAGTGTPAAGTQSASGVSPAAEQGEKEPLPWNGGSERTGSGGDSALAILPDPSPTPTPLRIPASTPAPAVTPVPTPGRAPVIELIDEDLTGLGRVAGVRMRGGAPAVFVPNGAGCEPTEVLSVADMARRYGEEQGIVAASNAGIFFDTMREEIYCSAGKNPDGVLIAGGVVLRSGESLDHSECTVLVIDEQGNPGWADYYADADALAAGTGQWYDIYGKPATGRIVSAVTGFVPILVGGADVYDPEDEALHGYANYVDHYTLPAARQIFGATAEGETMVFAGGADWTLSDAARAALALGCVFAYCLDGGDSVETVAVREEGAEGSYAVNTLARSTPLPNRVPTYLVFTHTGQAPFSAAPMYLVAELPWYTPDGFPPAADKPTPSDVAGAELPDGADFPVGVTLREIAAAIVVTETLENADGRLSRRQVYSAQGREPGVLLHAVASRESYAAGNSLRITSTPLGSLYYEKTADDQTWCLNMNDNTRLDGRYYDYSTGFTVETLDDLGTPGDKLLLVSYVPGGGMSPLTAQLPIRLG